MTKKKSSKKGPLKKTAKIIQPEKKKVEIKIEPSGPPVENTIKEKLAEIKTATESNNGVIPKGNIIEQSMNEVPADVAIPVVGPDEEPAKNKGGRPKGSKNKPRSTKQVQEEQEPGGKKIDQIMIYEEVALMGLCAKFKKDFKEVQLSPEEKDMLLMLQPETEFLNRPSWPNYIITNLALILIKWFSAGKIKEQAGEPETKSESFSASRTNSPEENNKVLVFDTAGNQTNE